MFGARWLILALAVGLGACGEVPRPFMPDKANGPNPLLRLEGRAGIVVLPVDGVPRAEAATIAAAVARRLRALEVPATSAGGNRESLRLASDIGLRDSADGPGELVLHWALNEPDGAPRAARTLRRVVPPNRDDAPLARLAAAMLLDAVPTIAEAGAGAAPTPPAVPGFPGARLVVLPLEDGPGDSVRSVPAALAAALVAAKLPVAARIAEDDLLLLGEIALGPPTQGVQDVSVTWRLVTARGDQEIGEIAQSNRVPAGALDGPWGPAARALATGAARGVMDLLRRAAHLGNRAARLEK
ncbi:MAG: hypothetical protein ACE5DS_00040 [Kiloniellaceae bacterium]